MTVFCGFANMKKLNIFYLHFLSGKLSTKQLPYIIYTHYIPTLLKLILKCKNLFAEDLRRSRNQLLDRSRREKNHLLCRIVDLWGGDSRMSKQTDRALEKAAAVELKTKKLVNILLKSRHFRFDTKDALHQNVYISEMFTKCSAVTVCQVFIIKESMCVCRVRRMLKKVAVMENRKSLMAQATTVIWWMHWKEILCPGTLISTGNVLTNLLFHYEFVQHFFRNAVV